MGRLQRNPAAAPSHLETLINDLKSCGLIQIKKHAVTYLGVLDFRVQLPKRREEGTSHGSRARSPHHLLDNDEGRTS